MDLKKLFVEEKPELKAYLNRINFSLDQVVSIETVKVDDSINRYVFKGLGFVFAVESMGNSSIFKPSLHFNEICIEGIAG
jgi:hypothetical protein